MVGYDHDTAWPGTEVQHQDVEATFIGVVPAGTKVMATYHQFPPSMIFCGRTLRLVLLQEPTGAPYWLHSDGTKEFVDG